MWLALAFLVLGLADAGYHRHEARSCSLACDGVAPLMQTQERWGRPIPAAETSKGEQQTLMGKAFCPIVQRARAQGMTDEQIIASAVANHIPQAVIVWAQKNCTVAVR